MAAGTYLQLLPPIIFVILPATFLATYVWSLHNQDIYPILPNISDAGSLPPESCLFSMMLNISAALIGFAVYIRTKEVREYFRAREVHLGSSYVKAVRINWWAGFAGILACIGLDVAANFQESSVVIVHFIGATICFWGSCLYTILQTIVSYWMVPEMNSMIMLILRGVLTFIVIVCTFVNQTTDNIAYFVFNGNSTLFEQWTPEAQGWELHVAASVSEWIVVLTLVTFILTFYAGFKRLIFYAPVIEVNKVKGHPGYVLLSIEETC